MKNPSFTLLLACFSLYSASGWAAEYTELERFLEGPLGRIFFKTPEGSLLAEKLVGSKLPDTLQKKAVIAALRRFEMSDVAGELATRTESLHARFTESLYRAESGPAGNSSTSRLEELIHTDFAWVENARQGQAIAFVKPLPELSESYNAKLRTFMMVEPEHGGSAIPNSAKNLAGIDLSDVRTRLSFKESRMDYADLSRSQLEGANFMRARLIGADFRGATLENVDLRGANLSGADFTGARFIQCDLRDVDLSGTNVKGVDLDQIDLRGATYDHETTTDRSAQEMLKRTGWSLGASGKRTNPWFGKYRLSFSDKLARVFGF